MRQLYLLLPFTEAQQTAMLAALASVRWSRPDSWCSCDSCRHSREAQALQDGTMGEDERERLARYLWDLPGIYQPPGVYIDYDPHEELHRAVYGIRWGT
jgi:hypothetical protein